MKQILNLFTLLSFLFSNRLYAQDDSVKYPYPVKYLSFTVESQAVKMAYMDEHPATANGMTVLLLHGKNFNGYYWKQTMNSLLAKGYRVVVPDQLGWGKSTRSPALHYSFSMLAANTHTLLDSLGVEKVIVVAHSMGGMLGTRFTLMYPQMVEKLVLENPIGLEDYKTFVPYKTITQQFAAEQKQTYGSYKKYQQSYYPQWKPEYEELVKAQAVDLKARNFRDIAFVNAITYDMIYNEPVCYEFANLTLPVLLIIGQADRTIVGKNLLDKAVADSYGKYPELGDKTAKEIPGAHIVRLPGVGHIPHIQEFGAYEKPLLAFLAADK